MPLTVKCLFLFRTSLRGTLPVRILLIAFLPRTDQIDLDGQSNTGANNPRQGRKRRAQHAQIRIVVMGNHDCQIRVRLKVSANAMLEYIQSTLLVDTSVLAVPSERHWRTYRSRTATLIQGKLLSNIYENTSKSLPYIIRLACADELEE